MHIGSSNGCLVRSLRVISYLISRGWVMYDEMDSIETTSLCEIHKYLLYFNPNGVRMFPPKSWNRRKTMQVLNYAKTHPEVGIQFNFDVYESTGNAKLDKANLFRK